MKKVILNYTDEVISIDGAAIKPGLVAAKACDRFSTGGSWYALRQKEGAWKWYSLEGKSELVDLSPGAKDLQITDAIANGHEVFFFEGGLAEWMEHVISPKEKLGVSDEHEEKQPRRKPYAHKMTHPNSKIK